MRDLDEKEVIEASGAGCETVCSVTLTCTSSGCTPKVECKVICTF